MSQSRRAFIKSGISALSLSFLPSLAKAGRTTAPKQILAPALKMGDTIGLITPASPLFEANRTFLEAKQNIESLGFNVKAGNNIYKKRAYLAGTIKERVSDIHEMFADPQVKAIMAIRGGYGSAQLLPHLDYDLIRKKPKILVGYSDISSLLAGIHSQTGLVTFHGPVAVSTFTEYTKKYFLDVLTRTQAVGLIDAESFSKDQRSINQVWSLHGGVAQGRLIGGNLTLMQALIGTPYDFDGKDKILFFEEVGEEPYDLDRILHQMKQAGKFDHCRGVFFDRLDSTKPASYKPAFNSSLSVEEVLQDVFADFDFPVSLGFSIGHIKDKPTLPLGVMAQLDADQAHISLLEPAVK